MNYLIRTIPIVFLLLVSGCKTSDILNHPTTQATLWVQNSSEYKALAKQAYNSAYPYLNPALEDSSWSALTTESNTDFSELPPAIILDVDETVLDNSPFQARMIKSGSEYDAEEWSKWVNEANAEAIPAAVELTQYAVGQGITVFFVTNRLHVNEEPTRKNLIKAGFPVYDSLDNILTKGEQDEWTSSKVERRKFIAQNYRVIMLFGDDLNDFISAKNISEKQRDELVEHYSDYFGKKWFILPNPVYGSWTQSITGFKKDLNKEQTQAINTMHLNSKN